MPKRQKQTREDKILDCERPPPGITLASFLDAQLAAKIRVPQSPAEEPEQEAAPSPNTDDIGATATVAGPQFTIRKNKKGNLPISYENRNKGKKVTVISNVSGNAASLVSELKRLTGSGGVQKGECIEIQGDRRDFLTTYLKGHPSVIQR